MKQIELMEKYPVFVLELSKDACKYATTQEIVAYLKEKIAAHPVATFIALFDHYAHTSSLPEGTIAEGIIAAQDVIFCFGKELPKPEVLGVRPRSIGIAEYEDKFIFSFLEAPNPQATQTMQEWLTALRKEG